eukprot:jgi/Bigna1/73136/fgenesh1_pg.23_\
MAFKRGNRVRLNPKGGDLPSGCCLRQSEIGTVKQIVRDQLAWRRHRVVAHHIMVRGPRGETTCFSPDMLIPASEEEKDSLPRAPALVRKRSCCDDSPGENTLEKLTKGVASPILIKQLSNTGEYEDEEEEDTSDKGHDVENKKGNDDDDDAWEEITDAKEGTQLNELMKSLPELKRTVSQLDSEIRVAYWRDPVKVAKEEREARRTSVKPGKKSVEQRIEDESKMKLIHIKTEEILNGGLTIDKYDVLCVPGGYAPNYDAALEDEDGNDIGGEKIKEFVSSGGGFVGICAGAYLGSNYTLGLIDADEVMGSGSLDEFVVRYANGPLLDLVGEDHDTTALALFKSDFAQKKGCPIGVMKDSPAILAKDPKNGKGRVVLISPHPENGGLTCSIVDLYDVKASRGRKLISVISSAGLREILKESVRGAWWGALERLDPRKYKPNLKDYGVPNGLIRLNKEARAARLMRKSSSPSRSNPAGRKPQRSRSPRAGGYRAARRTTSSSAADRSSVKGNNKKKSPARGSVPKSPRNRVKKSFSLRSGVVTSGF